MIAKTILAHWEPYVTIKPTTLNANVLVDFPENDATSRKTYAVRILVLMAHALIHYLIVDVHVIRVGPANFVSRTLMNVRVSLAKMEHV
jgi:hypothetical protein